MKHTVTALLTEPSSATPHRYQVYRQARNGLHYNHGAIIESAEDAVALFLRTSPAFEGGVFAFGITTNSATSPRPNGRSRPRGWDSQFVCARMFFMTPPSRSRRSGSQNGRSSSSRSPTAFARALEQIPSPKRREGHANYHSTKISITRNSPDTGLQKIP